MDDIVMAVRLLIRATATLSLSLFLLAYLAAPLAKLTRGAGWHAHRRRLGLAFAASHGVHLAAVLAFAALDPAGFQRATTPFSIASGSVAYAFIAAMVATSGPPRGAGSAKARGTGCTRPACTSCGSASWSPTRSGCLRWPATRCRC